MDVANITDQKLPPHSNGIYSNFTDGSCSRKNSFFDHFPNALQIILYFDGFELCNPLGSAKNKHKLLGIYMTLGNLSPWHRSKVDSIQLVALCFERIIKKYSFDKVFRRIVDDLKILETDGITMKDGSNIRGTLVAVIADNLGSHQIGGYVQNFTVNFLLPILLYKRPK